MTHRTFGKLPHRQTVCVTLTHDSWIKHDYWSSLHITGQWTSGESALIYR